MRCGCPFRLPHIHAHDLPPPLLLPIYIRTRLTPSYHRYIVGLLYYIAAVRLAFACLHNIVELRCSIFSTIFYDDNTHTAVDAVIYTHSHVCHQKEKQGDFSPCSPVVVGITWSFHAPIVSEKRRFAHFKNISIYTETSVTPASIKIGQFGKVRGVLDGVTTPKDLRCAPVQYGNQPPPLRPVRAPCVRELPF